MAVSVDARSELARNDADGDFARATQCVATSASGHLHVVTAAAKDLGAIPLIPDKVSTLKALKQVQETFRKLPDTDHKPRKLEIGSKQLNVKQAPPSPPTDALIVRVFNRQFGRTEKGELRLTVPEDYDPRVRQFASRYAEPSNDFMWVLATEWKALVPEKPTPGEKTTVPAAFALRLYRHHLDPARGLTEGRNFGHTPVDAGTLTLAVTAIQDGAVRLRLEGSVHLVDRRGSVPDEKRWLRYEPALLGHLAFDTAKQRFTRFDVVALGDVTGMPMHGPPDDWKYLQGYRPGKQSLGIAFELVANPTKVEHLAPRAAREDLTGYLAPAARK